MNRYRLTALEDLEVLVSDEHPATALVRGVAVQVVTRGVPRWTHLRRGEACEVTALYGVRGDLFESDHLALPTHLTTPMVIHEALKVEALPSHGACPDDRISLPNLDSKP